MRAYDSIQMVGHAIDRKASGGNDKKTLLQERNCVYQFY